MVARLDELAHRVSGELAEAPTPGRIAPALEWRLFWPS